jgi:hypothetical protein
MDSRVDNKKVDSLRGYQPYSTLSARLSLAGLLVSIARLRFAWHQKVTEIRIIQYISFYGRPTVKLPLQRFDQKSEKTVLPEGYRRPLYKLKMTLQRRL